RNVSVTSAGVESGLASASRSAKNPVAPSARVQLFDRRGCVPARYSARLLTPSPSSSASGFDTPYLASHASARPLPLLSVAGGIAAAAVGDAGRVGRVGNPPADREEPAAVRRVVSGQLDVRQAEGAWRVALVDVDAERADRPTPQRGDRRLERRGVGERRQVH